MADEIKPANPAPLGWPVLELLRGAQLDQCGTLPPGDSAVIPLAFPSEVCADHCRGVGIQDGNTFGMVAFTSYGAFWWWYAFLLWTVGAGWIKPPDRAASASRS